MEEFYASLVREKIVLTDDQKAVAHDPDAEGAAEAAAAENPAAVIIRSNRIFLRLGAPPQVDKIVVRAQNMHTTLRLASKILFSYFKSGSFLTRETPFDWQGTWDMIVPAYEREYNPDIWAAVYINGKPAFRTSSSPFVDVIEKCALLTIDNYDATMGVTESALKQVGKAMRINHSSNVATVFAEQNGSMRCGLMYRADGKDVTFSFIATGGEHETRITQCVGIAAAFVEALNLRHVTRALQEKVRSGEFSKSSPENRKLAEATGRLVALDKGIASFEEHYKVKYNPEKPDLYGNGRQNIR